MTRSVSEIVEEYLSQLRGELVALDAEDIDELVLEIRSLLTEAAADDPWKAESEVDRLGEPAELAIGILAERGLEPTAGMPTGIWWRLGIAAPVDLALGAALPLVAVFPLYSVARFGLPRVASIAIAIALTAAVLAWPFLLWRPWRTGGRSRTPGMTFTGLAVVRAPGSWRLVRTDELEALGLVPRRGVLRTILVALVGVVLLAGASRVGLDVGGSWLASVAISAEFSGLMVAQDEPLETQLQHVVEQVYAELAVSESPDTDMASAHVARQATRRSSTREA